MPSWLSAYRQLQPRERWTLVWLATALPLVSLALLIAGYARTRRFLEWLWPKADRRSPSQDELQSAQRFAALLDIAGRRGPIHANCLRQALLLYAVLRRRGLDPDIRFGVRRSGEQVHAHAWVELAGNELGKGSLDHLPFSRPCHES